MSFFCENVDNIKEEQIFNKIGYLVKSYIEKTSFNFQSPNLDQQIQNVFMDLFNGLSNEVNRNLDLGLVPLRESECNSTPYGIFSKEEFDDILLKI